MLSQRPLKSINNPEELISMQEQEELWCIGLRNTLYENMLTIFQLILGIIFISFGSVLYLDDSTSIYQNNTLVLNGTMEVNTGVLNIPFTIGGIPSWIWGFFLGAIFLSPTVSNIIWRLVIFLIYLILRIRVFCSCMVVTIYSSKLNILLLYLYASKDQTIRVIYWIIIVVIYSFISADIVIVYDFVLNILLSILLISIGLLLVQLFIYKIGKSFSSRNFVHRLKLTVQHELILFLLLNIDVTGFQELLFQLLNEQDESTISTSLIEDLTLYIKKTSLNFKSYLLSKGYLPNQLNNSDDVVKLLSKRIFNQIYQKGKMSRILNLENDTITSDDEIEEHDDENYESGNYISKADFNYYYDHCLCENALITKKKYGI